MIDEHEPALSAAKQTLLERRIQGWTADGPAGRLTGQVGAADTAPLSPAQEQLWHFSHLAPGNPVYNESVSIRKVGPLNLGALQATFNELLRRHQIWRTTFEVVDGEPRQVVHPVPSLQIPLVDLSDVAPADAEREAIRMAAEAARRPYDLAQGPLIRPLMVRFAADHHRLYLAMHHLIFDGVSLYRVILPELIALYDAFSAGLPSPLTEPALQYGDYAASERTDAAAQERSQALKYWRKHLSDAPSLALPLDHRRPATQQFRGGMEPVHIPKDLADGLDRLGRKEGGTFFQVIATAFAVLMQRYSGQDDVIFGTASDLRRRPELEAMVGYCLTPLVVRADLGGDPTFVEALGRVRGLLLDGLDHTVPFEHVVRDLGPRRDPGANPIFQAMLVLEPPSSSPHPEWSLHQMEVEVGNAVGHAKFDLHLELDRRPEGHVSGRLIYNSDLFDRDTARRMRDHWSALLRGIAEGPSRRVSELPLLTEEDRRVQLTSRHSAGVETPPGMSIHELVAVQAERVPDKVAIEFQEQLLTYRQLESQAEQLARRLRAAGVKPGSVVGLCLERSLEMVVGMLGILKLGAAYIPLDPLYPRERIAFVVADAGAQVILTQRSLVGSLPLNTGKAVCIDEPAETEEVLKGANSPELVLPGALAYVLYTSGSTGRPKGVRVSHANVVNLMTAMPQALGVGQDDAVLAVASYSFDMSVGDVWPTLGVGARLVVASPRVAAEAGRLGQLIKDSGTTIMHATPATWQMLVDNGWEGAPKLVAVSGGEALSPVLAAALLDRCAALWNGYGPTETTVYATFSRVSPRDPITVGRPIPNVMTYVLDKSRQPVPVGIPGEVYIGGAGVALGYVNRPDETAERFLPDPFVPGGRIYRTGDLARLLGDGQLQHLGRLDDQIKVRGFRIEPGEIEAALQSHPGVKSTTLMVREDRPGDRRLVAYIVPDGQPIPAPELRALLRRTLPDYMVPSAFVTIEHLRLTPNGKIDRHALPKPDYRGGGYVAPRGELEIHLAKLFAGVLGLQRVGADDDFFELGGNSLLAVRLLREVELKLGAKVPLASIFQEGGTVAGMASVIGALPGDEEDGELVVPIQPRGTGPILFFINVDESAMVPLRHLLGWLNPEQRVLGLLPKRVGVRRRFDRSRGVGELAEPMLRTIRSTQPHGPYLLAGWSLGGLIAYEIASRLRADGEELAWLGILDASFGVEPWRHNPKGFGQYLLKVGPKGAMREAKNVIRRRVRAPLLRLRLISPAAEDFDYRGGQVLSARYTPAGHDVPMDLFTSAEQVRATGSPTLGWETVHQGHISVRAIAATHMTIVSEPNMVVIAASLNGALRRTAIAPLGSTDGAKHS